MGVLSKAEGMGVFRIDNFYVGLLLGLIMPVIAYVLCRWPDGGLVLAGKPAAVFVLAGLVNLLLVRWFYRQGSESSARGVMLITFAAALMLFYTGTMTI